MSDNQFTIVPSEHELERASNSYLMSLIALIAGLPLPIINLIATLIFYLGNRQGTYYTRWHCSQALLSQLSVFPMNSFGFWWTVSIVFGPETISNQYFAYIMVIFLVNIVEFIATIYTAIKIRKGVHVKLWLIGDLTNLICKS